MKRDKTSWTFTTKFSIIENYIMWLTNDEDERERMTNGARLYVQEEAANRKKNWMNDDAQARKQLLNQTK